MIFNLLAITYQITAQPSNGCCLFYVRIFSILIILKHIWCIVNQFSSHTISYHLISWYILSCIIIQYNKWIYLKLEFQDKYLHIRQRFLFDWFNTIFSKIFFKLFISGNVFVNSNHVKTIPTHKHLNHIVWESTSGTSCCKVMP